MRPRLFASIRCFLAGACVLFAGTAPVLAADGVLDINQACAATGCFPGDAPGFPVEIYNEGNYRLTSSLDVGNPFVTAISIPHYRAITLDLNGFSITNSYLCQVLPPNCQSLPGDGIHVAANAPVTIRNGTLQWIGGSGIAIDGGTAIVEGVRVSVTGGDGIRAGGRLVVRRAVIENTGDDGIFASTAQVLDSRVWSTRGDGVEIQLQGSLWNVDVSATYGASLNVKGKLTGYAMCRFDKTPAGGTNLGQNLCWDASCPP